MSDIYKYAVQNRLRFPSPRGLLEVEQLFQLPLKGTFGLDLDTIARTINKRLHEVSEESFVEDAADDPEKKTLEVSLDIVKDVISTKQAENRAALARSQRVIERKKILDAMAAKKDEKLTSSTLEELEKKLAALDD